MTRAAVPNRREADRALVDRLRAGDAGAFASLVDAHHRMLTSLARTFVESPEAIEDVVQETWLGVIDGLGSYRGDHSLRAWIGGIAVRRAKARARREGRTVPFSALPDPPGDAGAPPEPSLERDVAWAGRTPEAALATAEAAEALEQAVQALPPAMRAVLVLRDVEGLGPTETCDVLGISEVNQRVSLHRARTRVQQALAAILKEERP